jgi:hypothetical protein
MPHPVKMKVVARAGWPFGWHWRHADRCAVCSEGDSEKSQQINVINSKSRTKIDQIHVMYL